MNARRVPSSLQDTLMSGVNALAEQTPVCLPPVPTAPAPAPAPVQAAARHGHGHEHHGHGKGHGEDG